MRLSIVTSMYYSAPYIEEFYERVCRSAEKITDDYEIIFVNDGSCDNSLQIAASLHEKDKRVRIIDLSRNFGHHKAIMTGLAHAYGELVFLLDCDLEEDPEFLELFYNEMKITAADVVYGMQKKRKGKYFERISGLLFYKLFNYLASCTIPPNLMTARLMSSRYVASLVTYKDQELFLAGLCELTGYKQVPLYVVKKSKMTSTYSLARKVAMIVNAITSFSAMPLVLIFYLGIIISSCSLFAAFYLLVRKVLFAEYLAGWPSLIVTVWFLGGVTIFCLGVIGLYVSKILLETKKRPYTIIRQIYERKEP